MRMYCIVSREALKAMNGNRGKLAAQAGHAYLHAYWDAEVRFIEAHPRNAESAWAAYPLGSGHPIYKYQDTIQEYRASGKATKVCLVVETTDELRVLEARYRPVCGVSLVTDAGLTCFDGQPTTTCLGIGPIRDEDVGDDLRALKVLI